MGDINYIAESTIEGEGQWLEGERRGLQKSRLTIAQCPHYCIVTMATSRTFETASSNSRIELIPDCSMRRHKLREHTPLCNAKAGNRTPCIMCTCVSLAVTA